MAGISEHADRGGGDENDQIIKNVMENLSQYSTPPGSAQRCHVSVPDLFFSILPNTEITHSLYHLRVFVYAHMIESKTYYISFSYLRFVLSHSYHL